MALPSQDSAEAFIRGDPGSTATVVMHTLGRACILGVGLYVAGLRGPQLTRAALFGSVAIETFALGWTKRESLSKE